MVSDNPLVKQKEYSIVSAVEQGVEQQRLFLFLFASQFDLPCLGFCSSCV